MKRFIVSAVIVVAPLLIPALFKFNWEPADYAVMGMLLILLGESFFFIQKKNLSYQRSWFFYGLALLIFLGIWAELAVGIFD